MSQRNPAGRFLAGTELAEASGQDPAGGITARHWVRVTRLCNNNCIFCLDKECQDGSVVPFDQLKAELKVGAERGAVRAILSGGEPTLHPNLIDLIRSARGMGYREVQVITNGRMFAYARYLSGALDAGLTEVTFSMHGHTARLHDWHTRTKGSFAQALKGLLAALRSGRMLVSVDIVLTRQNHMALPEMVSWFHRLGVREFDVLAPVPFGAAWEHRDRVFFDLREMAEPLGRALEIAERRGIRIWTNRLPAPFLEGREHLIQDPIKVLDEVRGREGEFREFILTGKSMPCAGERCPHCFMSPFCAQLSDLLGRLRDHTLTDASADRPAAHVVRFLAGAGARRLVIDRESSASAEAAAPADLEIIRRIRRPEEWDDDAGGGRSSREVVLTPPMQRAVERDPERYFDGSSVRVSMDPAEAVGAVFRPWGARRFWETLDRRGCRPSRTAGIPPCITRSSLPPEMTPWDATVLTPDGTVDLAAFARHFIRHRYTAKSLRCKGCPAIADCEGLPVRFLKRYGFGELGWAMAPATA